MPIATINISFDAGTDIKEAFHEAIRISKILSVYVQFSFNDVKCFANPLSSIENGAKQYYEASKKSKYKMAFA